MCIYIENEKECTILKKQCPYVYFCNKIKKWKEMNTMPANCKVKQKEIIPSGYYKVCFEKRGNLYIDINGHIEIVPNPFNIVPLYVKATKLKSGKWRLKEYEG